MLEDVSLCLTELSHLRLWFLVSTGARLWGKLPRSGFWVRGEKHWTDAPS